MEVFNELLKLWVLWYASAAAIGAFIGALFALWIWSLIKKEK